MKFLEYFSFARRLAYLTTSAVLEPRINLIMMNLFVISSLVNNRQWRNARAIFFRVSAFIRPYIIHKYFVNG